MVDTKTRILDSAEELFAEQGLAATSLRAITQAAGVNLAAVNYHFGSKEGLIREVFARRADTLNQRRLELLRQAQQDGAGLPDLQTVLTAFVQPALDHCYDPHVARYIKLLGRAYVEPDNALRDSLSQQHVATLEQFKPEFQRLLPHLSKSELYRRLHFCLGAMVYCMAGEEMMGIGSRLQLSHNRDTDTLIQQLVAFLTAGMWAPTSQQLAPGQAATVAAKGG